MRFNFLGGPGAGKSTTAAEVFARLKRLGYSVEHVNEYVKSWAYNNRKVDTFDQFYLQAKQMQYEYRFLKSGVRNIVTDSPVCLSVVYGDESLRPALGAVSDRYDKDFPCFNIFLKRNDKPYKPEGRYQTIHRAIEIDHRILERIPHLNVVNWDDMDTIMTLVEENAA